MDFYRAKSDVLAGTNLSEVTSQAWRLLHAVERRTRRQPYIRSAYFNKQKVFVNFFWPHLRQKVPPERTRRLKYLKAALEVIRYSRFHPQTRQNTSKPQELLHRFGGITSGGQKFYAQLKENKRTNRLYFMSCFPAR